jgi:hypothetical protein
MLGEVTLKSGRKIPVDLGVKFSLSATGLSNEIIGFQHMNGNRVIMMGNQIETIEAWEGEVEIDVPDSPLETLAKG